MKSPRPYCSDWRGPWPPRASGIGLSRLETNIAAWHHLLLLTPEGKRTRVDQIYECRFLFI